MTQYAKVFSPAGAFLGRLENAQSSYTLKQMPLSSGKLQLPQDDDGNELCQPMNRVELFDGDQRVDLFRVIGMPQSRISAQKGYYAYKLEHVLATLADDILPLYHEIGGDGVTMADCINYILGFQSVTRWQLGRCDFATEYQYSFSNAYLINALLKLPEQLAEEYQWTTDTTTTPWTLNLIRPSTEVECELRYRHNMLEIAKTYDGTELCTRCYPFGYGEGVNQLTIRDANDGVPYIDADTIGTWGIVAKPMVDTTFEQADALKRRAEQWLETYKHPRISYTGKAVDLSRLTEEPLDKFHPGKLCRVIDQEHGITVSVRVTQTVKSDPAAKPEDVAITLESAADNVASTLADLAGRTSVSELYAQGATNLFQIPYWNNADKDHPIQTDVDIPTECVRINKLWLIMHIAAFRSYTRGAAAGGGTTQSTTGGGGTVSGTASGGGTQLTQPISVIMSNNTTGSPKDSASGYTMSNTDLSGSGNTGASTLTYTGSAGAYSDTGAASGNTDYATASHVHEGNSHRHYVGSVGTYSSYATFTTDTSDNTLHVHGLGSHTHTTGAHTHSMSHTHSVPAHAHGMDHYHMLNLVISIPSITINIPSHTHSFTIMDHSHTVTLADHTHDDIPGIYDGDTVTTVTVKVDNTLVPASAINGGQVDLIPYLSKDAAGKIVRGNHTITLTPVPTATNTAGNCAIGGTISAVVFIRSQGGGDY